LRKKFGIEPHDRVVIESSADAIVIRPVSDFMELAGFLGPARPRREESAAVEATAVNRALGRGR